MPTLDFTVQSFTATLLKIEVKNSGAALDKALTIDLTPPAFLLDSRIIDAGKAAAESEDPPGAASLAGLVTGSPAAWSIWAKADITGASVPIMLKNDRNQAGEELIPPIKFEAGAAFTISIPLNPNAQRPTIEFPYVYKYGTDEPVEGKLQLRADSGGFVPDVTFNSDRTNPSTIPPGTKVKISWHIGSAVSAILRGPLPSGNAEVALSDLPRSLFKMSDGFIEMIIGGPVTYLLQAEVKRPDGGPNVQVVKVLSLDVSSPTKYAYIDAHPKRVLPFGLVEIDWSAWGLDGDVMIVAGDASRKIPLTEMSLNGSRQGIGVMRITAAKPTEASGPKTTVMLSYEVQDKLQTVESSFDVVQWRKMTTRSNFTGQPVGLAVAAPKMALLTTTGLWLATVGTDDISSDYNKVTQVTFTQPAAPADQPKAWLALAALGRKFFVVRQTQVDDVQVALYDGDGKVEDVPIDLPSDLRLLMKRGGAVVDIAVYGSRVYVVVEAFLAGGLSRRAFSVSFENTPKLRNEPLLESMAGYRLLTFDDTLYALHRDAGKMFRFSLKANNELDTPSKTAPAVSQSTGQPSQSMFKQGLFASVGRVMAVLDPSSVPSLKSLENFGLRNVLAYKNTGLLRSADSIPQDLVYNPQHDRWIRSGHGLDLKPGMVCAFRGGDSERLWVIDPSGETYTLTVGSEHLFAHDYITRLQAKELAPFFNKSKEITIQHNTGLKLGPLNDTCRSAGFTAFSATSPVEFTTPLPANLVSGKPETIGVRFNQQDPGAITLRYMVERAAGVKHDYVLEIIMSGLGLSTWTAVFKRVAIDQQGVVSVAEVAGSRETSTATNITFYATPLVNGLKLRIRNESPFWLWTRSPESPNPDEREKFYEQGQGQVITIKYNTPAFSIYAHGGGELPVDVDFAMPLGLEASYGVAQQKCVRINTEKAVAGFVIESISSPATSEDPYECTMRYRLERKLEAVYMGDGAPSRDGSSFYLPIAVPPSATSGQVLKINANDLSTIASASVDARSVFAAPNSLAVLADSVLAVLKNCELNIFDLSLKPIKKVNLSQYDLITNIKGGHTEAKFFTVGMRQLAANPPRYSYSFSVAQKTAPTSSDMDLAMDSQPGFTAKPVPGAPAWVSQSTIPLMDANVGGVAICIEGGLLLIELRSKRFIAMKIEGVVRQEAVLIEPLSNVVFFAHSNPGNNELSVSRMNPGAPTDRMPTVKLPFPLTHVVTDKNPPSGTNLQYNRPRAVSMAMTDRELFVSHATKISVIDKNKMTLSRTISLDYPCRLIQVRRGTLPATPTPYGHVGPRECNLIWALGSIYIGTGVELRHQQYRLYKLAVV